MISDFLAVGAAAAWTLPLGIVVAGVVIGLMPGRLLRLIVLIYPKDHPHRTDLVADLYGIPYVERIFWVFGQLDMAIAEGIFSRRMRGEVEVDHTAPPALFEGAETICVVFGHLSRAVDEAVKLRRAKGCSSKANVIVRYASGRFIVRVSARWVSERAISYSDVSVDGLCPADRENVLTWHDVGPR